MDQWPLPGPSLDAVGGDAVGASGKPDRSPPTRPLPPSARWTLAAVAVVTVALLPWSLRQLGPQVAFLQAVLTAVLMLDIITVFLLAIRFRDSGDRRTLAMACAYGWSAVIVVGYTLAFPKLVSAHPPLGSWASTAPWLYVSWHVGFPVLLGLACCPWPSSLTRTVPPTMRHATTARWLAAVMGVAAGLVALVVEAGPHLLPVLIHGTSTLPMSEVAGPPGMVLAVTGAVLVTRGLRARTGPERWATVTAWVCVADLLLTFASLHRFSVGWYAGRTLTVVAASLVFLAMLGELTRLQRQLLVERGGLIVEARTDPLTGLANRTALHDGLVRRLRFGAPDCLILLDMDRFKAVNDTYGHQAGDQVLVEAARRLVECSRTGDLVSRLGGDEFAVVLEGPFGPGELFGIARRLMSCLQQPYEVEVGGLRHRVECGASLGVSLLAEHRSLDDAVRRADEGLYRSKEDRSSMAALQDVARR